MANNQMFSCMTEEEYIFGGLTAFEPLPLLDEPKPSEVVFRKVDTKKRMFCPYTTDDKVKSPELTAKKRKEEAKKSGLYVKLSLPKGKTIEREGQMPFPAEIGMTEMRRTMDGSCVYPSIIVPPNFKDDESER